MIKAVFLKTCFSKLKANLYMNELNSRGIYTFLANENTSDLIPLGGGGFDLHVEIDRLDEALSIIEEMDANYEKEENFREATQEDIEYEKIKSEREESKKTSPLTYFILGIMIVILLISFLFTQKVI